MAGNSFPNSFWTHALGGHLTTGSVFFVDSGATNASDNNDGTAPSRALATWDGAINKCTANNGDIIVLMPGHAETVSTAGGIDYDVAGVKTVGMGHGASRPTITFSATDADLDVDAASAHIENVIFTTSIDATTGILDINAADCTLKNIETRDGTGQATDVIVGDANVDRLHIDGWVHRGAAADGGDSACLIAGAATDVHIENFHIVGNFDTGAIESTTGALVQVDIHDGYIWNQGAEDLAISLLTASTGKIGPNIQVMLTDDAANITEAVACDAAHFFQPINICNTAGEVGMQTNITATTDAIV